MLWLKACPRCHGDLLLQADLDGDAISCIQCGYMRPVEQAPEATRRHQPTATAARKAA